MPALRSIKLGANKIVTLNSNGRHLKVTTIKLKYVFLAALAAYVYIFNQAFQK